jgi:hypothetical protein
VLSELRNHRSQSDVKFLKGLRDTNYLRHFQHSRLGHTKVKTRKPARTNGSRCPTSEIGGVTIQAIADYVARAWISIVAIKVVAHLFIDLATRLDRQSVRAV